ncbi:MAG: MFS transporter, partial [Candidatus Omnitrophota bacterium]
MNYLDLLKKRNFFCLWFGQIISQFGDRLTQIALIGLVSKATTSSTNLAFMLSMTIIPVFLFSPVAGVYVDRWDNRKTMYISDFIRGIIILLIPIIFEWTKCMPLIYIVIFFAFSVGRFFIPAKMALVPKLVEKKELFAANSLISITATVAAILGIGVGGVIVETWGADISFFIDSGTFFLSAISIIFIPITVAGKFSSHDILDIGKEIVVTVKKSVFVDIKESIKYVVLQKETRYAFRIFLFLFSYAGAMFISIKFIQNVFASVTKDFGFMTLSLAVGIFIGSVIYGKIAHKFNPRKVISSALMVASLYLIFFTIFLPRYPVISVGMLFAGFLGMIIAPVFVAANAMIHSYSDRDMLGRIFSFIELIGHMGFFISMFTFSFIADLAGTFTTLILVGIIGFCLAFME